MCNVFTCAQLPGRIQFFGTPWTVAREAPLSMVFSRKESWSGMPFLVPENLPDPGIKPESLAFPALAGRFFTIGKSKHRICIKQL